MFDPVQLRSLADRASAVSLEATAVRDELDAMLPLAVSPQALAAIAGWPEEDRDCRENLLHAMLHLSRASASIAIASGDLGRAVTGIEI